MMVEVVADLADSHVCCCCATGTASSVSLAKVGFDDVARRHSGISRPNTQSHPRTTIVSPRFFVVAAQETTMPPGCHHRATVGLFGTRMRQPIRQFRHILSVAVFPRASNAQAGPTTSDPEWASIPHFLPRGSPCFFWTWHPTATTPLVSHQFSPCADRGSSPSLSSGLNLTFIAALHRPRDRHRHFFLALTRTGPLSISPCPPAFRQTGDSWPRSHMPCWFKTVVRSFPGSAVRPFWKFQRPKLFQQPRLDVSSWLACSRFN